MSLQRKKQKTKTTESAKKIWSHDLPHSICILRIED